jgi:hypothetical protein
MDIERMNTFKILKSLKKTLEAELRQTEQEIRQMEDEIVEMMVDAGVQSINIDGATIYLHTQLWARPEREDEESDRASDADYERACEALREAGLAELVKPRFNIHSLSAVVRGMDKNGEPIPEQFEGAIKVSRVVKPNVRGA